MGARDPREGAEDVADEEDDDDEEVADDDDEKIWVQVPQCAAAHCDSYPSSRSTRKSQILGLVYPEVW